MPARIRYKKIGKFVEELAKDLAPLKPVAARVKFTGSYAIDKDGGFSLSGKAEADVATVVNGVPVSVEGGLHSDFEAEGKSNFELEITFG